MEKEVKEFVSGELASVEVYEDGSIRIWTIGESPEFETESEAREWIAEFMLSAEQIEAGPKNWKQESEEFHWHRISVDAEQNLNKALK